MVIDMKSGERVEIDGNNAYLTVASKVIEQWHRAKVILHDNWQYYLGEFKSLEAFKAFADKIGITFEEIGTEHHEGHYDRNPNTHNWEWKDDPYDVTYYKLSHKFQEGRCHAYDGHRYPYFWKMEELPEDAKPIMLKSNGSMVIGYFTNDDGYITLYRPNPNAKEVYRPIPFPWNENALPVLD